MDFELSQAQYHEWASLNIAPWNHCAQNSHAQDGGFHKGHPSQEIVRSIHTRFSLTQILRPEYLEVEGYTYRAKSTEYSVIKIIIPRAIGRVD